MNPYVRNLNFIRNLFPQSALDWSFSVGNKTSQGGGGFSSLQFSLSISLWADTLCFLQRQHDNIETITRTAETTNTTTKSSAMILFLQRSALQLLFFSLQPLWSCASNSNKSQLKAMSTQTAVVLQTFLSCLKFNTDVASIFSPLLILFYGIHSRTGCPSYNICDVNMRMHQTRFSYRTRQLMMRFQTDFCTLLQ